MLLNLSKVLNEVYTLVFPERCFGCNATLYRGEQLLCAFCRNELPLTDFDFGEENTVDCIFYGRSRIEKASAMLFYSEKGMVQRLLHNLKYGGHQKIGGWLGAWYVHLLLRDPHLERVDFVFPVPLHKNRQRKRGYNQCRTFGQEIAHGLGAEYSEKFLIRNSSTHSQTRKDRWLRWQDTRGVFKLCRPHLLEGSTILLIDDVITTGSTLESCCTAFDSVDRKRIFVAAMAVVP